MPNGEMIQAKNRIRTYAPPEGETRYFVEMRKGNQITTICAEFLDNARYYLKESQWEIRPGEELEMFQLGENSKVGGHNRQNAAGKLVILLEGEMKVQAIHPPKNAPQGFYASAWMIEDTKESPTSNNTILTETTLKDNNPEVVWTQPGAQFSFVSGEGATFIAVEFYLKGNRRRS